MNEYARRKFAVRIAGENGSHSFHVLIASFILNNSVSPVVELSWVKKQVDRPSDFRGSLLFSGWSSHRAAEIVFS